MSKVTNVCGICEKRYKLPTVGISEMREWVCMKCEISFKVLYDDGTILAEETPKHEVIKLNRPHSWEDRPAEYLQKVLYNTEKYKGIRDRV